MLWQSAQKQQKRQIKQVTKWHLPTVAKVKLQCNAKSKRFCMPLGNYQKTLANCGKSVVKFQSNKDQKQKVLQRVRLQRADCGENSVPKIAKCSLLVGKTKRRICESSFARVVPLQTSKRLLSLSFDSAFVGTKVVPQRCLPFTEEHTSFFC